MGATVEGVHGCDNVSLAGVSRNSTGVARRGVSVIVPGMASYVDEGSGRVGASCFCPGAYAACLVGLIDEERSLRRVSQPGI